MAMHRTTLPRSADGVRWDGLALAVDGPARPPLRFEVADGRRMVLLQGEKVVLLARQRVTHFGVHYARTGRYASPLPPLRADVARIHREACPDDDAWFARWAHHFADELRDSPNGPLHEGDWQFRPGMSSYAVDAFWESLWHDPDRGHIAWFSGSPEEDSRDILALRPLSDPDAARVKAYRRQYREGVLPPVLLWGISALDCCVVLDGHDRLLAALAEGGRPPVLRLNREHQGESPRLYAQPAIRTYEERVARLGREQAAGDPLAEVRIANASRSLAKELQDLFSASHLTRSWPLSGGAPAWDALARQHAPGWHPDTRN
ncbi:hypothetical protein AB0I10_26220 [Streptomyces sp. NPDC050636]|uniref:hypothetical protein n=1 Tax=Streptomyces sp. NPDC050636 TaxID=3154510 RepID=UPI0034149AB0